jgi:hypothetical protein
LASCKGYRNTARFLASTLNLSTRESKARVAYTTLAMPLARKELAAGRITCEHMFEIHQVLSLAPADLSDDLRDYAKRTLVELAVQAQPLSMKTAGIRLKAYRDIDKPPKDPEERLARPRRRLKYWFSTDGQMHFTGELDPETAALLKGILTPLAKPRPMDEFGQEDTRDEDERNGDALAEALGLVNNAPDLPATGGSGAAVIVTSPSTSWNNARAGHSSATSATAPSATSAACAATPKSSPPYSAPKGKSSTSDDHDDSPPGTVPRTRPTRPRLLTTRMPTPTQTLPSPPRHPLVRRRRNQNRQHGTALRLRPQGTASHRMVHANGQRDPRVHPAQIP